MFLISLIVLILRPPDTSFMKQCNLRGLAQVVKFVLIRSRVGELNQGAVYLL